MAASRVPLWAHVRLTHAALQWVADQAQVDLLHVKGPATDLELRDGPHSSSDADVLVRPAHLSRFTAALEAHGWSLFSGFDEGSPFEHAANYSHPSWTLADVHRQLPGPRLAPAEVFDRLWRDRRTVEIAHHPCAVLSRSGQVLMQTMHAARSRGREGADAWRLSDQDVQSEVRMLAEQLNATTPLAAGIGELDAHRDAPDHALWQYWSTPGGDRLEEWSGRLRAASGIRERMHVIGQALRVNRTHLALRLERTPTTWEVMAEQGSRIRLAFSTVVHRMLGRRR